MERENPVKTLVISNFLAHLSGEREIDRIYAAIDAAMMAYSLVASIDIDTGKASVDLIGAVGKLNEISEEFAEKRKKT